MFLYLKKHTQTYASYPEMDISCIYDFKERGVDLEVAGARYIVCPPPSLGGDLELEGGVTACHDKIESRDSHVRGTE